MGDYWNDLWANPDIQEYMEYAVGYTTANPEFLDIFAQHNIKKVCDAACGFGAYSIMLLNKGFEVYGFDISYNSIYLTERILTNLGLPVGGYRICSITDISYPDMFFDGVVANAVLDHLSATDADVALEELHRIVKPGGLIYISFDAISEDDTKKAHTLLEDGSFLYKDGLRFKYYADNDISDLLKDKCIVFSRTAQKGTREVILQNN